MVLNLLMLRNEYEWTNNSRKHYAAAIATVVGLGRKQYPVVKIA